MPIRQLTERVDTNLATIGASVDPEAVRGLWAELVDGPEWSGPPQWVHGDLHLLTEVFDGKS
jgi:aminoglycoside phosphotransferase (APT) family kinase protein